MENIPVKLLDITIKRWTVTSSFFFDEFLRTMQFVWKSGMFACLKRLQPDVRARIIGCEAQMERFDFFFGLHLG